jgi:hypothetical protein
MNIGSKFSSARRYCGCLSRWTHSLVALFERVISREMTQPLRQVTCRMKGHKLKVIVEDMVFVCDRCEATYLRKDLAKPRGGKSNLGRSLFSAFGRDTISILAADRFFHSRSRQIRPRAASIHHKSLCCFAFPATLSDTFYGYPAG